MENKMKKILFGLLIAFTFLISVCAHAAADLDINGPAIANLKASMQARHANLAPFYNSGAIGLTKDGLIAVKDASAVPLKDRQSLNSLVTAENADRNALYKEIAVANGHAEWEAEIRSTFAQRWTQKAQAGWWVQDASGWVKR
jgi:uncharacterized protein YdbL (DUF1318 family)